MAKMNVSGLINCYAPITNFTGSRINFDIVANEGYYFPPEMQVEIENYWSEWSFKGVSHGDRIEVLNWACDGDFSVFCTAVKSVEVKKIPVEYNLNNSNSSNMELLHQSNTPFITLITAHDGYQLELVEIEFDTGAVEYSTSNFINDNTQCEVNFNVSDLWDSMKLTVYTSKIPSEKISDFSNLYMIDNENLSNLSKERFITIDGSTIDIGSYITDLYLLPFKIPSDFILDSEFLKLGFYETTTTKGNKLNNYKLKLLIGSIDFKNIPFDRYTPSSNCTIHLPYNKPVNIDISLIINRLVECYYTYDLYTGDCTITILGDGVIIHQENNNHVIRIPINQNTTQGKILGKSGNITFNDIDTMQVVINSRDKYINPLGYNCNEILPVQDGDGFIKCELLNFECDFITGVELETLISILRDGVIF